MARSRARRSHPQTVERPEAIDRSIQSLAPVLDVSSDPGLAELLAESSFLLPLLLEGSHQIRRIFEPDTRCDLLLRRSPDSEQAARVAHLIPTPWPRQEARERLVRLDEEWWNQALERTGGQLIVDICYV